MQDAADHLIDNSSLSVKLSNENVLFERKKKTKQHEETPTNKN